jgi:hypothetical protein
MVQEADLYLGRLVEKAEAMSFGDRLTTDLLPYPLEHLTTHALLLGATGSGKTGLGLVLVEEVLRQGVPVLLLDVKGDLANLQLTFPDLMPTDFLPWIDADAALRRGQTPEAAARATAQRWREGLAAWDIGPEHIAQLRQKAEITIYTPGSRAGRPVNLLARFSAPPVEVGAGVSTLKDEAAQRAQGLASALLGLAGIEADPLRSREHILLTTLIRHAWETLGGMDIATLIQLVQQPPIERVGVFDLESFFPQDDRFELALTLNNLLAAPGFALWREGEPVDMDRFLMTPDGRPRASIFYLAHLAEAQQRFFVTLFLEELRSWVRHQPGTRTLRALLYFDEVYGYLPPYPANPPTKVPLMALVKQGRAAGLGIVLATQNPADLDYKGLGNIGTWFVGTLRTERDKHRILEGMEGTLAQWEMKPADVEATLSRLQSRRFLMHNARAGHLTFFESRWAMSYLRGPLTPAEIQRLLRSEPMAEANGGAHGAAVAFSGPSLPDGDHQIPAVADNAFALRGDRQILAAADIGRSIRDDVYPPTPPPAVDPSIPQAFLPATVTAAWAVRRHNGALPTSSAAEPSAFMVRALVYRPYLLGVGVARIFNDRVNVSVEDEQAWLVDPRREEWNTRWDQGEMIDLRVDDLASQLALDALRGMAEAHFASLPGDLGRKSAYPKWESALKTHIYHNARITIWGCTPLKLYSRPEETKRDYLERCRVEMERLKEEKLAAERQKFETKLRRIQDKIRREELELEQDHAELAERKREELLSGAESLLGLFSKRGRRSRRVLSRASRQRRYVRDAKGDVEESVETLAMYQEQLEELEDAWQMAAEQIIQKWESTLSEIREITVHAKRADIDVRFCGLAWFPFWAVSSAEDEGEMRLLPAYVPLAT